MTVLKFTNTITDSKLWSNFGIKHGHSLNGRRFLNKILFSPEPKESLDSSTKALNQNFSELEARRARRQHQQHQPRSKPEPKPIIVRTEATPPPPPSTKRERRPSSSKSIRKSSFGVTATPSVRTSETQTEKLQQQLQQSKPVRRYASMNDVRKSRKSQMVDNSMTTFLTESEVIIKLILIKIK